jgi:hypothetical protein
MKLYVSGPAVKSLSASEASRLPQYAAGTVYRAIRDHIFGAHQALFPIRNAELDELVPDQFYKQMFSRIELADGVFTFLFPGDQSTPVESVIAATLLHKPQCILSVGKAPRLIIGLPRILELIEVPINPTFYPLSYRDTVLRDFSTDELSSLIDREPWKSHVGYLLDRLFEEL